VDSFRHAVNLAITSVRRNYNGAIKEVSVGVPSAFITIKTKGHTASYPSKRKITQQDVDALYASGLNQLLEQKECIRQSAIYFELGDNRRYFNVNDLYGLTTNRLKGALCYYFVEESFYEIMNGLLKDLDLEAARYVPSTLAQAMYLLPQKRREGYAFFLDIGFITSSFSVVYGNGIVREETFDCGVGSILVSLVDKLKIDYRVAQEILASANISGGKVADGVFWTDSQDKYSFSVNQINEIIKNGLGELCGKISRFYAQNYKDKSLDGLMTNPICVSGEGLTYIKGAIEYISNRLEHLSEMVYPDLPFYDKPTFSSRISLLNSALSEREKSNWLYKIFHYFGGKRKW
jgi:cell division ATPase FtsA